MAEDGARREIRGLVTGNRDAGYDPTSEIIAETAICLLGASPPPSGGIRTISS